MTKKSRAGRIKASQQNPAAPGRNLLLTLTLVPLVIGVLLIGAWIFPSLKMPSPR